MRALAPLACALALAGCAAAAAAPGGPPRLRERRILQIALSAARRAGDAHPALIQHSAGTREAANRVDSGDIVPGRRWSYLIAERGRFVLRDAPVPMGAPPPHGTVLTLVVDAATGRMTDAGACPTTIRGSRGSGGSRPTCAVPASDRSHTAAPPRVRVSVDEQA